MGVDITIHVCKYDNTDNLYHELKLYRKEKDEFKEVSLFEGRNCELFDILSNNEEINFPSTSIAIVSLDEELKESIKKSEEWSYGFNEVTLADIKCHLKDYPTVVDYDADWGDDWKPGDPQPRKENPVSWFFKDILSYTEFAEGWTYGIEPLSRYKLIYWFSH